MIAKYLCISLLDKNSTVDTSSLDSLSFFYQYLCIGVARGSKGVMAPSNV